MEESFALPEPMKLAPQTERLMLTCSFFSLAHDGIEITYAKLNITLPRTEACKGVSLERRVGVKKREVKERVKKTEQEKERCSPAVKPAQLEPTKQRS